MTAGEPTTPNSMNIVFVSPSGLSTNAGTQQSPVDLVTGLAAVSDTGTVYMLDGTYQVDDTYNFVLGRVGSPLMTIQAANGMKPLITSLTNTPPKLDCKCNINGLWMGGTRETEVRGVIFVADNITFSNNTIFGYWDCVNEGSHTGITYQGNRFINCGGDGLWHSLYISGAGSNAKVYDNIFLGGQGYHLHCWHDASNVDIQRNFFGGGNTSHGLTPDSDVVYDAWQMVIQDITHIAQDNVHWNHVPWHGARLTINFSAGSILHSLFAHHTFGSGKWNHDTNDATHTFDRNGLVGDVFIDSACYPSTPENIGPYNGAGDVLPGAGTNYTHYALTDLPALLGYSEAQIDAAVAALVPAFGQDLQTIHDDVTIENNFATLKAVVDAWKAA